MVFEDVSRDDSVLPGPESHDDVCSSALKTDRRAANDGDKSRSLVAILCRRRSSLVIRKSLGFERLDDRFDEEGESR